MYLFRLKYAELHSLVTILFHCNYYLCFTMSVASATVKIQENNHGYRRIHLLAVHMPIKN